MKPIPPAVLLVLVLAAASNAADLPEPGMNEGATSVTVDGTRVTSEVWAKALGHAVDAIVVARLVQQPEGPPKVETYERWTLDGKTKFQRGDKALGRIWETLLWEVLEESAEGAAKGRKRRELMERVDRHLPQKGRHESGAWVVTWTLGKGLLENGGRPSVARVAVFTITPAVEVPSTPREKEPAAPTTPGSKAGETRDGSAKNAKDEDATSAKGEGAKEERPVRPVTPGAGERKLPPWVPPLPGRGGGGSAGASSSGLVEGRVDSDKGVRKHARVEVDLWRDIPRRKPAPKEPEKPTTPRGR